MFPRDYGYDPDQLTAFTYQHAYVQFMLTSSGEGDMRELDASRAFLIE
jgi:hypothetical protein